MSFLRRDCNLSSAQITTLANFSGTNDDYPSTALTQGADGNLYGTTRWGGSINECEFGCGTVFKMASDGALMTMYGFCTQSNCDHGGIPLAQLVQAASGDFYGTTSSFGTYGGGTVFKITIGGKLTTLYLPRSFGKIGQAGGILGQGFTGTSGVFLNGTSANFTVVSDTFIRATVSPGATTGFITVATPGGTLTSSVPFHVIP